MWTGREAYGPEIALQAMWSQQRHRFDPELLTVFIKLMGTQPVKQMEKKSGGTVQLGA